MLTEKQVNAIRARLKRARPGLLAYAEAAETGPHAQNFPTSAKREAQAVRGLLKDVETLIAAVYEAGTALERGRREAAPRDKDGWIDYANYTER